MALFTTLYSGSSGNCGLVLCGQKYLLIDMGKSCRVTMNAIKQMGLSIADCEGILVTHEHSDHVKGMETFLKHYNVPVYGSADTIDMLDSRRVFSPSTDVFSIDGRLEEIGAFAVSAFPTSHDVPCCGFKIQTNDGKTMALATDLGVVTPVVHENLYGCDFVAIEANYDSFMLHGGTYPYHLKVRIASDRGHLDNKATASEILELVQSGCKKFALCHLSQNNNTPQIAANTVHGALVSAGVDPNKDCFIQVQKRNEISQFIEF